MKSTNPMRFTLIYALCFLLLLLLTSFVFLYVLDQSKEAPLDGKPKEIYVYLPQEDTETESHEQPSATEEEEKFIVKEYQGRIGIFSSEGRLLDVIDTYVKTLPEADRSLLGEGILVKTKEALNSLVEDYSH